MNSLGYKTALATLNMTHAHAAELFDVHLKTSRRWANGARVPREIEIVLQMMIHYRLSVHDVLKNIRVRKN